ncbi:50S ribosomal protein L5 [Candidatus Gottesmanbacteria bacterium]|nr:50S ribosomal protein L5 [Candidatus Gottesmanbacteria bacterium]
MSQLFQQYQTEIKKKLAEELNIKNVMAIPKLTKVVLNCSLGEALENKKVIEEVTSEFTQIAGQKPVITHAKHDISAFKLRRGDAIGIKVTLRGQRMYDFVEKLVKIVLPRIRDFRGVPSSGFAGFGDYSLGLSEQIVFPEIEYSKVSKVRGLQITFVTTGKNKEQTSKLLVALGMPFTKAQGKPSVIKN